MTTSDWSEPPYKPLEDDDPRELGGFTLNALIGEGGMGRVYHATAADGQRLAIKIVRPAVGSEPHFHVRFQREVAAVKRVPHHRFFARVIDARPNDPMPWLATEYVPGPSLDLLVKYLRARHGELSVETLQVLIAGVAQALLAMHNSGLVHRDLKPSNVLVTRDGPKVIDFGIARAADSTLMTTSGSLLGTPAYMSPEQARGEKVTPASDVFALGGLACFAATGRPPFGDGSMEEVLNRIRNEPPDLQDCPEPLRQLAAQCLNKDALKRPDLKDIIARLTAQVGILPGQWLPAQVSEHLRLYEEPPAFPEQQQDAESRWSRWARQLPLSPRLSPRVVAAAAAVSLAVAVAGFGGWYWYDGHCGSTNSSLYRNTAGECVGVTDGGDLLDPQDKALRRAQQAIHAENKQVEAAGSYVSIAFLGPLTSSRASVTSGRTPHELEGAFTAVHRANTGTLVGDHPKIRLLLANEGSDEKEWETVVGQLKARVNGGDHLVAVVGLGLSQQESVDAARALAKEPALPMISDVITADGFDSTGSGVGGPIPGLIRMAPSISDQFAVIAGYLRKRSDLKTAILVSNATTVARTPDLYTSSLTAAFGKGRLKGYLKAGGNIDSPFDPGDGNLFAQIAGNLCGHNPPDMVFYAGRAAYLRDFLGYLQTRNCRSRRITVVTGSDAASLTQNTAFVQTLKNPSAPISVLYTPLADPSILSGSANPDRGQYRDFASEFTREHFTVKFPADDLRDGWAIMAHDATLTAAKAIRNATRSSTALPTPKSVHNQLYVFSSTVNTVPGAGGSFQINSRTGARIARPNPVLQIGYTG